MKHVIGWVTFALVVLASGTTWAATHSGRIQLYHLNATVQDRGVCIRMNPPLPGTGWACLWQNNLLYGEITDLLLKGYIYRKSCAVVWNTTDSDALIDLAECRN
jgi:hypothetical protein